MLNFSPHEETWDFASIVRGKERSRVKWSIGAKVKEKGRLLRGEKGWEMKH